MSPPKSAHEHSLILRHMPSLDSMRGAAILAVIVFHAFGSYAWRDELGSFWGPLASAAVGCRRFGVNGFFVLSGFLITTLLCKARQQPDFYKLLNHIDIHYKTPFVLDYIAYGALLAILLRQGQVHAGNATRIGGTILAGSSALMLLVVFAEAFHFGKTLDALADLPFTWAAGGILLLGLKRDHTRLLLTGRTASHGFLPFYGYISYGLYLINSFVFAYAGGWMIRHIAPERLHNFAVWSGQALVCIGLSTGLAFLSRRYFEAPILAFKDRRSSKTTPLTSSLELAD